MNAYFKMYKVQNVHDVNTRTDGYFNININNILVEGSRHLLKGQCRLFIINE